MREIILQLLKGGGYEGVIYALFHVRKHTLFPYRDYLDPAAVDYARRKWIAANLYLISTGKYQNA